jgi:hypothetical protein
VALTWWKVPTASCGRLPSTSAGRQLVARASTCA